MEAAVQTAVTPEASAPPVAATTPETPSKFKVVVDGSEQEVDIEELRRGYTHSKAANKRFQEAANLQKQITGFLERAKGGDLSWLKGLVPEDQIRQFAQNELLQHIEFEQLSEEGKALRRAESERERLARELEEERQEKMQQQQQAMLQRAQQEIDQEITATLKEIGRKPTARLVRRIAEQMYASLQEEGAEPLPAKEALQRARRGIEEDLQEWLAEAPVEELVKSFPKAKLEAIRRHFVEEVRPTTKSRGEPFVPDDQPLPKSKMRRGRSDSWFEAMDKKLGVR